MKLWDRIQRGMEAGFDATIAAVHTITEKAGESIELTRLRREKARYETQLTRLLAALGNTVYEKISKGQLDKIVKELGIKNTMAEIAEKEARMIEIERKLGQELEAHNKTD